MNKVPLGRLWPCLCSDSLIMQQRGIPNADKIVTHQPLQISFSQIHCHNYDITSCCRLQSEWREVFWPMPPHDPPPPSKVKSLPTGLCTLCSQVQMKGVLAIYCTKCLSYVHVLPEDCCQIKSLCLSCDWGLCDRLKTDETVSLHVLWRLIAIAVWLYASLLCTGNAFCVIWSLITVEIINYSRFVGRCWWKFDL